MKKKILLAGIYGPTSNNAKSYFDFGQKNYDTAPEIRTLPDLERMIKINSNTGNYLIGEGAEAALSDFDVTFLPAWYLAGIMKDEGRLQQLNGHFSQLVVATANMLRPEYAATFEKKMIERISLPTTFIGMGLQNASRLQDLPADTTRLLDILKERGDWILTRGDPTAQYLSERGLSNVRVTGCPSLYVRPDGMRQSLKRLGEIDTFSFESVMTGGYVGRDQSAVSDMNVLSGIARKVRYVLQDEFLFYGLGIKAPTDAQVYNKASGQITADFAYTGAEYRKADVSFHIFFDTELWRTWARESSLFVGRRFHGGIIAMQSGVPTVFLKVDDRMREMLGFNGFPSMEASVLQESKDRRATLEKFVRDTDTEAAIGRYDSLVANFRTSLKEAGL